MDTLVDCMLYNLKNTKSGNKIELNFGWSVFSYLSHLKGTLLAVLNASVRMGHFLASKEFISGSRARIQSLSEVNLYLFVFCFA